MIVGNVQSAEEAQDVEFIAKSFVVANRVKALAQRLKETNESTPN